MKYKLPVFDNGANVGVGVGVGVLVGVGVAVGVLVGVGVGVDVGAEVGVGVGVGEAVGVGVGVGVNVGVGVGITPLGKNLRSLVKNIKLHISLYSTAKSHTTRIGYTSDASADQKICP